MAGFGQNITTKVVFGFLTLAIVFGAGAYLIFDRLHDLDPAVQRIREPNKLIRFWRESTKNTNAAVTQMRGYLLTGDTMLLQEFEETRAVIENALDSMRIIASDDKGRVARVDSLRWLLERKMEESALGSDLFNDNSQMVTAIDNAVQLLALDERKREQVKKLQGSNPDVGAVKKADSVKKSKSKSSDKKDNFWQRMLHNRKKEQADTNMSIEAVASMLDSILADSAKSNGRSNVLNNTTDTIHRAMQIANELNRAKNEDFMAREAELEEELLLLAQRRSTDSLLTELGIRISQAENKAIADRISEASEEVRNATYNIITILSIGCGLLIIFFTVLIRRDVRRSAKVQRQLIHARQAAEELAKTREEFAANMSHEIRGPLNAIIGISEQLNKNSVADRTKLTEGLVSASQHLLGLINPVLDVTRLNSGKIEFESQSFDIRKTITDVERAFANAAMSKKLLLGTTVSSNVPEKVVGDNVRLRQVLFNLVSNALKFTEKGSISITCELKSAAGEDPCILLFKVTDSGIGIAEDSLRKIFVEYSQADKTIARRFGGTGLGLAICRKLVELQHGSITVESTPGTGSTFTVELPFGISKAEKEAVVENAQHVNALKGLRIIVCDDDEMNLMLAQMIISNHGGAVTECVNGEQVLEEIAKTDFDLILIDINLPGIDGKETVRRMREGGKAIPAIAVTGNAHERTNFKNSGFDAIVIKPYQESELLKIISEVIPGRVHEAPRE